MASILGFPGREQTLTNSAAEFLETRGDTAMGSTVAQTAPGFVPELDRFVPKDNVPNVDYHKESRERLEQFKRTLAAFQQNLVDSKADKKFDITIKDVQECTLDDVLEIANTVQQSNKKLDNVHRCTKRIKKLFRSTGRNAQTIKKLLAFAPTDVYGAVICGGFTMILGALERYEKLRETMYDTLEKVPLILRKLDDWLDVHHQSPSLKFRADDVLVAIFVLLELIVREILKHTAKKAIKLPFKGEAYGSSIDEAVATLAKTVAEFESAARLCDSQRLGQINEVTKTTLLTTQQLHEKTKSTDLKVQQISQGLSDIRDQFVAQLRLDQVSVEEKMASNTGKILGKLEEKTSELSSEEHGVQVHNVFYCFLTSNPSFDSKTGLLKPFQAQPKMLQGATPARPDVPEDWSKCARRVRKTVIQDLADCFQDLRYKPSAVERNRTAFILMSDEIRTYLRSTLSKVLVVELLSDNDQDFTPASYAVAVLIRAVQKIDTFPILYHFCVPRACDTDSKNTTLTGSCGVLISLISQLLDHLKGIHGINLEILSNGRNSLKRASSDSDRLILILEELIGQVPKPTCVYIVLDSVYKIQNHEDQDVLDAVLGLAKARESFVKILVTSPFSLDILDPLKKEEAKQRKRAKKAGEMVISESNLLTFYVPEHVDGGHYDFNTSWVEEEMDEVLRGCSNSSQASSDYDVERKKKQKKQKQKKKSKEKKKKKKKRGGDISSQSGTGSSGSDDTADLGQA
ncbi:hypothetical protein PG987_011638 [Apiospora arundinis]